MAFKAAVSFDLPMQNTNCKARYIVTYLNKITIKVVHRCSDNGGSAVTLSTDHMGQQNNDNRANYIQPHDHNNILFICSYS